LFERDRREKRFELRFGDILRLGDEIGRYQVTVHGDQA